MPDSCACSTDEISEESGCVGHDGSSSVPSDWLWLWALEFPRHAACARGPSGAQAPGWSQAPRTNRRRCSNRLECPVPEVQERPMVGERRCGVDTHARKLSRTGYADTVEERSGTSTRAHPKLQSPWKPPGVVKVQRRFWFRCRYVLCGLFCVDASVVVHVVCLCCL